MKNNNINLKISKEMANMVLIMDNNNLDYRDINHLALAWATVNSINSNYCDDNVTFPNWRERALKSKLFKIDDDVKTKELYDRYYKEVMDLLDKNKIYKHTTWDEFEYILKHNKCNLLFYSVYNFHQKNIITPYEYIKYYTEDLQTLPLVLNDEIEYGEELEKMVNGKRDFRYIELKTIKQKLAYVFLYSYLQVCLTAMKKPSYTKEEIEELFNRTIRNYDLSLLR